MIMQISGYEEKQVKMFVNDPHLSQSAFCAGLTDCLTEWLTLTDSLTGQIIV